MTISHRTIGYYKNVVAGALINVILTHWRCLRHRNGDCSVWQDIPQGTTVGYLIVDSFLISIGTSPCHDDGFQGPGIPAGFVLQTITCNTPVYTNPGGTPSGVNAITAGQTWYVNPVPVKDAKGNSWTEVFVSSYNDPFIPTSCLGGAPAK